MKIRSIQALLAMSCNVVGMLAASTLMVVHMTTNEAAAKNLRAPSPYMVFCIHNREDCRNMPDVTIDATTRNMTQLAFVNKLVNASITPRNEPIGEDKWHKNVSHGDCDEYVMTKRSKLIKEGMPAGALKPAVVETSRGTRHLVLLVQTTAGDYLLDNRYTDMVKPSQTKYKFIKVSTANPTKWEEYRG